MTTTGNFNCGHYTEIKYPAIILLIIIIKSKATSRSRPARPAARGAIGGRPASTTSSLDRKSVV